MDNKKTEITQEVDIIHVECGYHLRLIDHDDNTGMSLFECPKCNRYLIAGEYIPQQEKQVQTEIKTSDLVASQEPPSDQTQPPVKYRRRRHKSDLP